MTLGAKVDCGSSDDDNSKEAEALQNVLSVTPLPLAFFTFLTETEHQLTHGDLFRRCFTQHLTAII